MRTITVLPFTVWVLVATAATGGQAAVSGTSGPAVTHAVATTSGSGATVTTSTQTVNGKTVIVRTVHPAYHDN